MVSLKALRNSFQQGITNMNQKISRFFSFVGMKLKNYKNLSWGEQIAYPCVGLGLILVLTSLVLFLL